MGKETGAHKPDTGFGLHLKMDLAGCEWEFISDLSHHFNFLSELPGMIGMTKITQPYVFHYSGLVPEDKGITGNVIIAESHIAIHSFELKGHIFVDIFSCKYFDVEKAKQFIIDSFNPTEYDCFVTPRGRLFNHTHV